MPKKLITILIIAAVTIIFRPSQAEENLAEKLAGRLLLQVEAHGEAWYVNPADQKRYFLDRPSDAFDLMRNLSVGITNNDLVKIPIGIIEKEAKLPTRLAEANGEAQVGSLASDRDNDGLADNLENALGTDPENPDSDNDGYGDKTEIENNYNPLGNGKLNIDSNFASQHLGKIFLQVEKDGQAWYLNPTDQKRYFLGRPSDAFAIMRNLSLGITNQNLDNINIGYFLLPADDNNQTCAACQVNRQDAQAVFDAAASAVRQGKTSEAVTYFTTDMQKAVEYTLGFLDSEGRFILGNIMSGADLESSTDTEKTFSTKVYFSMGGYEVPVNFYVQKQADGAWLLTNL